MDLSLKGQTLFEVQRVVAPGKLEELAAAIDTASGADTASLVPYFGPTLPGEEFVRDKLAIDLTRTLMAGISYEWCRPFVPGETVDVRLYVEDAYEKSGSEFAVVATEFHDRVGELIQRQRATFIQRGGQ